MDGDIVRDAFALALKHHYGQEYGEGKSYMTHLYDVVVVLTQYNYTDPTTIAAAWLHDIIEDTPCGYHDVKEATNSAVADIVYALTDELAKNRKGRKEKTLPKLRGNNWASVIKVADWIANVRESYRSSPKKLQMYQKDYQAFAEAAKPKDPGDACQSMTMWDELEELLADRGTIE